jgi:hypothetical protein
MEIRLGREMNQLVAVAIAIEANNNRETEQRLVTAYRRVLDDIYDAGRERREQRRCA